MLMRDTLCCGNSTLIDYLVIENQIDAAKKRALQMTQQRRHYSLPGYHGSHVQDVGLFSGIAGIGYAYLRTAYPDQINSILV